MFNQNFNNRSFQNNKSSSTWGPFNRGPCINNSGATALNTNNYEFNQNPGYSDRPYRNNYNNGNRTSIFNNDNFNRNNYSAVGAPQNNFVSGQNTEQDNQPSQRGYVSIQKFRQHFANRQAVQQGAQNNIMESPQLFMGRDKSYPDELNNLMNPFFCHVCNARLNSIKSSNMHYESKAHNKHITAWLKKTYGEKGETIPEVPRFVAGKTETPSAYYCEPCKLELTSAQHALQHFNGKKHRQAVWKISPFSGIGYFNVEGNWVKTGKLIDKATGKETKYIYVKTPTGSEPVVLQEGKPDMKKPLSKESEDQNEEPPLKKSHIDNGEQQLTLNTNNLKAKQNLTKDIPKVNDQIKTITTTTIQTPQEAIDSKECKICNITTTSNEQMVLHLKGARHTKKLKTLDECPMPLVSGNSILESLDDNSANDISMYRTPTGSFYCKTCDIAVSEAAHLKRHIQGKKHLAASKRSES